MKLKPIPTMTAAAAVLAAMILPSSLVDAQNRNHKSKGNQNPFHRCATLEQQIDTLYRELDALEDEHRKIQLANLQNRKRLWTLAGRDRENEEKRVGQQENESKRRVINLQHEVALKRNQIGKAHVEVGQIERQFFLRGPNDPKSKIMAIEKEILKHYTELDEIAGQVRSESLDVEQLRNRRSNIRGKERDNEMKRLEDQIHGKSQKLVDLRTIAGKTQNEIGRLENELLKLARQRRGFRPSF